MVESLKNKADGSSLTEYYSEVAERLNSLSQSLINIDTGYCSPQVIEEIYLHVASLRSASHLTKLQDAAFLILAMERSLEQIRQSKVRYMQSDLINTLLRCLHVFFRAITYPKDPIVQEEVRSMVNLLQPFERFVA